MLSNKIRKNLNMLKNNNNSKMILENDEYSESHCDDCQDEITTDEECDCQCHDKENETAHIEHICPNCGMAFDCDNDLPVDESKRFKLYKPLKIKNLSKGHTSIVCKVRRAPKHRGSRKFDF